MLMKAEPMIQAVESIFADTKLREKKSIILFPSPSHMTFNQQIAQDIATTYEHVIFVCGRYEGIDDRFVQYMQKKYPDTFVRISL